MKTAKSGDLISAKIHEDDERIEGIPVLGVDLWEDQQRECCYCYQSDDRKILSSRLDVGNPLNGAIWAASKDGSGRRGGLLVQCVRRNMQNPSNLS